MLPLFCSFDPREGGFSHETDLYRGCHGTSTFLLSSVSYVLANKPKEDPPGYSGISSIYYILIGLILAYGAYDSLFKKLWVYESLHQPAVGAHEGKSGHRMAVKVLYRVAL